MKKLMIMVFFLVFSATSQAEIAVIVHKSNTNVLDTSRIAKLFTSKKKKFPDGSKAIPINQNNTSPTTEEFNSKVLKKTNAQVKAYWSVLLFTGKGTLPKELANSEEVVKLVATNPNIIGYVDSAFVNDTVKVVAVF